MDTQLLPVVPRISATLDEHQLRHLHVVAQKLAAEDPALAATDAFGDRVRPGMSSGLWLVIGDTREIALSTPDKAPTYEYRLSLLARRDDLVAFGREPHSDFEHYRSHVLGTGPVVSLNLPSGAGSPLLPLAARCRLDGEAFSRILDATRRTGSLTIVPHIGMGSTWQLAAAVAEAANLDVRVASPPPRLTRVVNDKLWFARLIGEVLGENALPPTLAAYGPAALAHRIRALAQSAARVVVKVPYSAGGAGNLSVAATDVAGAALSVVKDYILAALHALGWYDVYPLLVGLWEAPALSSPSVQLWIPALGDGPPLIEGLFEQQLLGTEGAFVGSVPAELPERWRNQLADDAMRLATVLQLLGYFGRCSLDALVVGQSYDSAALHWIECNGRWGGVSIPMTIVNRLSRDPAETKFVVAQRVGESQPQRRFADAIRLLDGLLFRPGTQEEGIILLSPVEIEAGRGVQMLACAETTAAARELSERAIRILSGRSG
ncbi:hypothetical protein KXD96_12945 [Mycobacterium sp. SMC-2]|uniref:hypothetical protein n=1 Tax=Mycobacterium sp. SMC-2 TaxID=2857058 RepID=UPI0021B22006|nr:hypothetical protein [Mycobacterium sp. SMC-2]UXA08893.1 hypothetical protein KXD96_12945 [Mycobacterium sp. SMC-2]